VRRPDMIFVIATILVFGMAGVALTQGGGNPTLDPVSGANLFRTKGCVACHAINGVGGTRGPDLGRIQRPGSVYAFAASMWNHLPPMSQQIWTLEANRPYLTANEMSDLVAFLETSGVPGPPGAVDLGTRLLRAPGDAQRGRQLVADKGCLVCHSLSVDEGRRTAGGSLDRPVGFDTPWIVMSTMWNHTFPMELETRKQGRTWPRLSADEMADVAAFLAHR
jgi:cytochrome c551/c552